MALNSPQVTTIICTYRRPEMLRRAIESALCQTYKDLQVCVYDNASGDETRSLVEEFMQQDKRVKYYCRPENIGLISNYFESLKDVETPYFSFLADDDVLLPDFYRSAIQEMNHHQDAMLFAGSFRCLTPEGNKVGNTEFTSKVLQSPNGLFEFVRTGKYPCLHAVLFRHEVASSCKSFIEYLWFDQELLCRTAAKHTVILSPVECLILTLENDKRREPAKIEEAWLSHETVAASVLSILDEGSSRKFMEITQSKKRDTIYFMGIELLYRGDLDGAITGAQRIKQEYETFWQPFILISLALLFKKLPFIRSFLQAVRYLEPYVKPRQTRTTVLSYDELMNIFHEQKK